MLDIQNILNYYNEFPFLIKLAWAVTGVLSFAIVLLTIYLKIIRSYLRKKEQANLVYKNEYEACLVEYLYSGNENEEISSAQRTIINKLKEPVKDKAKRKVIISILYKLMNEVSGEMSDYIQTLYHETGLINFAIDKLYNKNWYIAAKGIGELTRFNIEHVNNKVSEYASHPRNEVRNEAHLYLVNLFRFEGLKFLNNLTTPLSEWAQVQLLETLQKFDDQQICDIKPWLKSSNNSVVLFALKLAEIYNQFEVKEILMELLEHENKLIRISSIEVLSNLYGIEAKEMLKANFKDLSLEEQISFFEMLEKLVIPSDEPFIEKHLFHKNFEIQLLALKILKSINIDKFMGLNERPIKEKANPELLKFVQNT